MIEFLFKGYFRAFHVPQSLFIYVFVFEKFLKLVCLAYDQPGLLITMLFLALFAVFRHYYLACFLVLELALSSAARHCNFVSLSGLFLALSRCSVASNISPVFSCSQFSVEHRLLVNWWMFFFSFSLSSFLVVRHIFKNVSLLFWLSSKVLLFLLKRSVKCSKLAMQLPAKNTGSSPMHLPAQITRVPAVRQFWVLPYKKLNLGTDGRTMTS